MNTNDENEWFFIIWLHHLVALDEEKNKSSFVFIALSNGKSTKFQNQFSYFGFGVLIVSIA